MRDAYHDDLDAITDALTEMAERAAGMMGRATTALLDSDLGLAESVIAADDRLDALRDAVEHRALEALARQQPVARDLRLIVTGLQTVTDLERMGDYAEHIARAARRRHPASPVPPELRPLVSEMGRTAQRIVVKVAGALADRDAAAARQLEADDDAMDELQRRLFTLLLSGTYPIGLEAAVDVTLIGRYYERYCDHAVAVARRIVYLVTGRRAPAEAS